MPSRISNDTMSDLLNLKWAYDHMSRLAGIPFIPHSDLWKWLLAGMREVK